MDQYQQQHVAGMMAGMGVALMLFGIVITLFLIFIFWRIFAKAGFAGALALLLLIPGIGWLIALCILAFGRWNVVPVSNQYGGLPPSYPPQYPPATYPPAPPTQL